jgi:dihydroorotate dehydrogenase electron transfer subunit
MNNLKIPYDPRLNTPLMTPILEIKDESPRVKTFKIKYNPIPEAVILHPGQFVMVWVPGIDEIPMSISRIGNEREITISVADVGIATHALHQLKVGDKIGIRGPYGNWYQPKPGLAIIIGGGIGMASLLPLIGEIRTSHVNRQNGLPDRVIVIEGAKTEDDLLFTDEIQQMMQEECDLEICTDDGTCGFRGFVTEKMDEILQTELETQKRNKNSLPITVYSCGPERMLSKVFQLCEKYGVTLQASMERMMRCAFGICGLCALDPTGYLVCRDGPIFESELLRKVSDFGKVTRNFSGKSRNI